MIDSGNDSTSNEVAISSFSESDSKSTDNSMSVKNKRKIPFESDYCKGFCMKLYLQEEAADVHFVFNENGEQKKLPAHKYMLATGSPVFQSMFYGDLKEEGDVTITDATYEAFEEFLQFFYLADVTLTIENAAEVLNLVNKYGAVECFAICERFLLQNLTMESVCWALDLASLFDRIGFRQSLLKKFMEMPEEVFASDSFKECTPETLKTLLECDNLNCNEKSVFDACIAWSERACKKKSLNPSEMPNLRQQLGDCLYLIKFAEMHRLKISACVSSYSELFTREELVEIIAILSADDTKKLQYFVRKNEVKTIEWKNYATLMFSQVQFTESDVCRVERTLLKTNKKVILGAVATQIIHKKKNGKRELLGVLTIRERDTNRQSKTLLEQPFVVALGGEFVPRNFTKLNTPIVVEANKVYTLWIEFDSSWMEKECTTKKCLSSRSLSVQDCTVRFEGGIVSHLYLN